MRSDGSRRPPRPQRLRPRTVPIVFASGADPVAKNGPGHQPLGQARGQHDGRDLAVDGASGQNAWGFCLNQMAPNAAIVALLVNPRNPGAELVTKESAGGGTRPAAANPKCLAHVNETEIDAAFEKLVRQGAQGANALLVQPPIRSSSSSVAQIPRALGTRLAIPAIYPLTRLCRGRRRHVVRSRCEETNTARSAFILGGFSGVNGRPICQSCRPTKFELVST